MGKHLIFVYGTLKRGWGNNTIIHDQQFAGVASTFGFDMYSLGGFPGVVRGKGFIRGELWVVDDTAFARCDRLEGHPNFYKREQTIVMNDDEQGLISEYLAWIYIYQGDVSRREPIDNWTR